MNIEKKERKMDATIHFISNKQSNFGEILVNQKIE